MGEHVITNQEDIHATVRMATQDRTVNKVLVIELTEIYTITSRQNWRRLKRITFG